MMPASAPHGPTTRSSTIIVDTGYMHMHRRAPDAHHRDAVPASSHHLDRIWTSQHRLDDIPIAPRHLMLSRRSTASRIAHRDHRGMHMGRISDAVPTAFPGNRRETAHQNRFQEAPGKMVPIISPADRISTSLAALSLPRGISAPRCPPDRDRVLLDGAGLPGCHLDGRRWGDPALPSSRCRDGAGSAPAYRRPPAPSGRRPVAHRRMRRVHPSAADGRSGRFRSGGGYGGHIAASPSRRRPHRDVIVPTATTWAM